MAEPAKPQATYADLEAVPPHLVAEILFGSLVTHPRPAPPHAFSATSLSEELVGPFQKGRSGGPGGWVFADEPELHLGPHVIVPDLAGWRRERMPQLPAQAFIETPPDWACELLSPSTQRYDRGAKRRIYATYRVGHLWHLDAVARQLDVFELKNDHWVLYETFEPGDDARRTALGHAMFYHADDIGVLLLDNGADINARDSRGRSVLDLAKAAGLLTSSVPKTLRRLRTMGAV